MILGVAPNHDSGAVLLDSTGTVRAAVNEGRLRDEKRYWGFPSRSIETCLDLVDSHVEDVDHVAIGARAPSIGNVDRFDDPDTLKRLMEIVSHAPLTGSTTFSNLNRAVVNLLIDNTEIEDQIADIGIDAPVSYYDHHYCHATSAYYTSPFDTDTLVVTLDGSGEFRSGTVYSVDEQHELSLEAWTPFYHSLGKFWSYVTYNLGFDPLDDAGKIAGLAATGDPDVCIDTFRRYLQVDTDRLQIQSRIGCWNNPAAARLHEKLQGYRWTDIAAALQYRTEEVVRELVSAAMERFECTTLAVAGGVFANVKLNQRLLALDEVHDIYVHPQMGDGGLGMGAAYAHWAESVDGEPTPNFLETVYLGPQDSTETIRDALDQTDYPYERPDNPDERVGELLAEGYVVGRYDGRLEYGPRALGNRSILAAPTDESCQDWLNERLDRTEFMPFAPSVLGEHVDEYFQIESGADAGRFMTITFDAQERTAAAAPAVVHIDGTARPQIVHRSDNPGYHRAIEAYYERTGIPIVLNTSFNAHGDPIVNTPQKAIAAYEDGIVDALSIGDFVLFDREVTPTVQEADGSVHQRSP